MFNEAPHSFLRNEHREAILSKSVKISAIRVKKANADAKLLKLCKLSLNPTNADANKEKLCLFSTKLLWLSD